MDNTIWGVRMQQFFPGSVMCAVPPYHSIPKVRPEDDVQSLLIDPQWRMSKLLQAVGCRSISSHGNKFGINGYKMLEKYGWVKSRVPMVQGQSDLISLVALFLDTLVQQPELRPLGDDFPIETMITSEGEQWGRYNLPRFTLQSHTIMPEAMLAPKRLLSLVLTLATWSGARHRLWNICHVRASCCTTHLASWWNLGILTLAPWFLHALLLPTSMSYLNVFKCIA